MDSAGLLSQPSFQKPPLWILFRQSEGPLMARQSMEDCLFDIDQTKVFYRVLRIVVKIAA